MGACIIAEAGINHNGDLDIAKKMIDVAADAGADYIKFRLYEAGLTQNAFIEIKNYCREVGVGFAFTPHDMESIDFLDTLNMDFWKIPSGEITNYPFLLRIARTGKPVIMSTGMSDAEDIQAALVVLLGNGCNKLTLLHCNSAYPVPFETVNLRAMLTLGEEFNIPVGYSDHASGINVPLAAAALGATVIEKLFTLDKEMEGPDHKSSINPEELKLMISSIREIELALGDGLKKGNVAEKSHRISERKSIVAARDIEAGETFSEENLTVKKPGTGVSPMRWKEVMGLTSDRDYKKDEMIRL